MKAFINVVICYTSLKFSFAREYASDLNHFHVKEAPPDQAV